jgi:hypothetical protein
MKWANVMYGSKSDRAGTVIKGPKLSRNQSINQSSFLKALFLRAGTEQRWGFISYQAALHPGVEEGIMTHTHITPRVGTYPKGCTAYEYDYKAGPSVHLGSLS